MLGVKPYYQGKGVTVYNCDSLAVIDQLGNYDLLLTDPPYGIGEAAGKNKSRSKMAVAKDYGHNNWDDTTIQDSLLLSLISVCQNAVVFGGNYYGCLPASPRWFVWDKDNSGDFADAELAWTNSTKAVRIFKHRWNGMLKERKEYRWHPTQKPEALMRWCLGHFPKAQTVLDPFLGSGTTAVACVAEGRQCVGIEREEKYCEAAANRLEQGYLF